MAFMKYGLQNLSELESEQGIEHWQNMYREKMFSTKDSNTKRSDEIVRPVEVPILCLDFKRIRN
jgi:hypothetical protein